MSDSSDNPFSFGRKADRKPDKPADAAPPAEESESLTISQMDGRYSTMRPANKSLTRMHILLSDGTVQSVQYHHSDVKGTFKGGEFEVIFAGTKHWSVRVKGHGPKFWEIYDYITLHRWPYLREAIAHEAKFSGEEETVLTEIKILDVTPKPDD